MTHTSDSQHTPASDGGRPERNWRRHGSRYRARRRAVDILFEAEARDVDPVAIVEDRVELARQPENAVAPVAEYTRQIVTGAAEELDGIDENIERYLSEDWELHRLPAVDRAILRVAVWELLHNPDVPRATAVVEGVELASEYSHNAAPPYIHAVLDDVAQSLAENNPLRDADEDDVLDADAGEDVDSVGEQVTPSDAPEVAQSAVGSAGVEEAAGATPSDAPEVSQPVGEDTKNSSELVEASVKDADVVGTEAAETDSGRTPSDAPEVAQSATGEVSEAAGATPSDAPEVSQPVGEDTDEEPDDRS